ncbi:LysR family transcriptional regulator [Vibrio sp.]|nr:LysR family transcriptional regulator [Vibrio viridaestus]MDC0610823.1 LysR family transcriptional regulator [Vibrio sp.]
MTFEQLKTFLRVVKLGGIRKAALEMNITQPAISTRITTLEEELGVLLLNRQKSGVTPTKEGLLLMAHAEKIEANIAQIKTDLTPTDEVVGVLRIGVAETIARSWLSGFLADIRKTYPKLVVELSVDVSHNLRELLLNKQMDMVVLMGPLPEGNVENLMLPPFELAWYCASSIDVCDIQSYPIISFPRLSRPYQELMSELLERYGDTGQIFSSTTLSTSLEMVSSGIGVGIVPVCLARPLVKAGKIKTFDPGWKLSDLQFTASYLNDPKDHLVSQIAKFAADNAQKYAEQQLSDGELL